METHKKLHETALRAPKSSGVYLWKDETGLIIYVGKAKNLKNRLTSYFNNQKDVKTKILVSRANSIEYITTENEYEALLLENTLIKQHSPRYNINLKDGKSYPVIRITKESFPRILKTRSVFQDGSRYFGPFPNIAALDTFIEDIYNRYPIRHCKRLRKRTNPCIYYHMGRCCAPCCGKISSETYNEYIDEISQLLEGDIKETLDKLKSEMLQASKNLNFEKAAHLRDSIKALQSLNEQNAVEDFDPEARDYIAYASEGPLVSFAVLRMREGKLIAKDTYRTKSLNSEEELLPEFLVAYYGNVEAYLIPPRIFVPTEKGLSLTVQWFNHTRGIYPSISVPRDKRHEAAISMAHMNAKEDIVRRMRERGDMPALEELRSLLNLKSLPVRIEGFDISHIGGKLPVASLISFYNGNPDRKNYRYFRLKTTDGIIDDFASMKEVTSRRYTRLLNEQSELPDLILIDGGIGQVNAVKAVLDALHLDIPLVGIAERNEDLYLPGNSKAIKLPRRSDALRLLQRIRDETHRFATTRNQQLRTKVNTTSVFEKIPGIGKARALKLLDTFGNLESLIKHDKKSQEEHIVRIATLLSCGIEQATSIFNGAHLIVEAQNKAKSVVSSINKTDSTDISELARLASQSGYNTHDEDIESVAESEPDYNTDNLT